MANTLNVTIRGRVGTEIQLSGTDKSSFVRFRLVTTPRFRDSDGTWRDGKSEWFTAKAWGKLALNIYSSIQRGQPILATGRIVTESWEGKNNSLNTGVALHLLAIGHDLNYGTCIYTRNGIGTSTDSTVKPDAAESDTNGVDSISREAVVEVPGRSPLAVGQIHNNATLESFSAVELEDVGEDLSQPTGENLTDFSDNEDVNMSDLAEDIKYRVVSEVG